MSGLELFLLAETIRQLSTELLFLFIHYRLGHFIVAMVFSLDLMIIVLTLIVQKLAAKHLTIYPIGKRLGLKPYYTKRQIREMEQVFRRGIRRTYREPDAHESRFGPLS